LSQGKTTIGALAAGANPSLFAMVHIKIPNSHPKNLALVRIKRLGYVLARKLAMLLFVMVLISNCKKHTGTVLS
jgi:hypothetical protein